MADAAARERERDWDEANREARRAAKRATNAARAAGETGPVPVYLPDWETATPENRLQPSFIIIGVQRGGTTSLFRGLEEHPDVGAPARKEIHYFDRFFELGPNYYASYFPELGTATLTGEATPYYLYHPDVPARVRAALPAVKLIAILRNPVSRAHSHYQMMVRRGVEPLSFEAAIAAEADRLANAPDPESDAHRHYSYLHRGQYAEQLERWFAVFPREQITIVRSEDFYQQMNPTFHSLQRWLGLREWSPPQEKAYNTKNYTELAPATREQLAAYFAPHNDRLTALLGRDMGWK